MSRILMLLTNEYAPDPRVAAEIETLIEAGRAVRLICWDRDVCVHHESRDGSAQRTLRGDGVANAAVMRPARETQRGGRLTIDRIHIPSTHGRGLSQAWRLARFWRAAYRRATEESFDAVHAHDFDTWPLAWQLSRRGHRRDTAEARGDAAPLVLDAHESYSDMMRGHLPGWACRLIRRMEDLLLPQADAVITVGQRLAAELSARGARNVCVLPNCKRRADYQADEEHRRAFRDEMGIAPGQWTLGYVSHLGPERPVPAMIRAVAAEPRVVWIVGGDGHFAPAVREAAARHCNIRYLGRVPPRDVPRLSACVDAIFCGFDPDNPNARFSAPNKLFEALAAGRPLLTGTYGEIGEIVTRSGCGIALPRFDEAELSRGLAALSDPAARVEMATRSAELGRTQYDWDFVKGRLIELYDALQRRSCCAKLGCANSFLASPTR